MLTCQFEVHVELIASMYEEDQMYVRGLSIPPIENDSLSESISNGDRVCLFNIVS